MIYKEINYCICLHKTANKNENNMSASLQKTHLHVNFFNPFSPQNPPKQEHINMHKQSLQRKSYTLYIITHAQNFNSINVIVSDIATSQS